jgi:hypothetical protein
LGPDRGRDWDRDRDKDQDEDWDQDQAVDREAGGRLIVGFWEGGALPEKNEAYKHAELGHIQTSGHCD